MALVIGVKTTKQPTAGAPQYILIMFDPYSKPYFDLYININNSIIQNISVTYGELLEDKGHWRRMGI